MSPRLMPGSRRLAGARGVSALRSGQAGRRRGRTGIIHALTITNELVAFKMRPGSYWDEAEARGISL